MKYQPTSAGQYLQKMGIAEHLNHDEAAAAMRRASTASNTLWPLLNGNDVYALANAAVDEYMKRQSKEFSK